MTEPVRLGVEGSHEVKSAGFDKHNAHKDAAVHSMKLNKRENKVKRRAIGHRRRQQLRSVTRRTSQLNGEDARTVAPASG